MQTPSLLSESRIHFDEPIQLLLSQKDDGDRVWAISPEVTVYEAIERMAENHVGALVVLSAHKLNGIVSERDYARKVILKGRQSREMRVHEIMSKPVYYVDPEASINECTRLMTSHHVRHLPVLQRDNVIGMISMGDLVAWIISSHERMIHQLESYISGKYPG